MLCASFGLGLGIIVRSAGLDRHDQLKPKAASHLQKGLEQVEFHDDLGHVDTVIATKDQGTRATLAMMSELRIWHDEPKYPLHGIESGLDLFLVHRVKQLLTDQGTSLDEVAFSGEELLKLVVIAPLTQLRSAFAERSLVLSPGDVLRCRILVRMFYPTGIEDQIRWVEQCKFDLG